MVIFFDLCQTFIFEKLNGFLNQLPGMFIGMFALVVRWIKEYHGELSFLLKMIQLMF